MEKAHARGGGRGQVFWEEGKREGETQTSAGKSIAAFPKGGGAREKKAGKGWVNWYMLS